MARRRDRSVTTPALAVLRGSGAPFSVHEYYHDPRSKDYGEECSRALAIAPERVFKTLVVSVDNIFVNVIVPVSSQAQLKAVAQAFGSKRATLATQVHAERVTGYVLGGISPLGQRSRLQTVIDDSALEWSTIFLSAGRRGVELEIAPDVLITQTHAIVSRLTGL